MRVYVALRYLPFGGLICTTGGFGLLTTMTLFVRLYAVCDGPERSLFGVLLFRVWAGAGIGRTVHTYTWTRFKVYRDPSLVVLPKESGIQYREH